MCLNYVSQFDYKFSANCFLYPKYIFKLKIFIYFLIMTLLFLLYLKFKLQIFIYLLIMCELFLIS